MVFNFEDVPSSTAAAVNAAVEADRLPQSIMISGGTLKTRTDCAEDLAQVLICPRRRGVDSCKKCPEYNKKDAKKKPPNCAVFNKLDKKIHPDVIYLTPNKRKTLDVETVREEVIAKLIEPANEAENKVFIFPDADETVTPICQNTLLKSVEEPPANRYFIFICSGSGAFLPTVNSRFTEYPLGDAAPAKNKRADEKRAAAVRSVLGALCSLDEFGLLLALGKADKKDFVFSVCEDILTVIRDALVMDAGVASNSGYESEAMTLYRTFDEKKLFAIRSAVSEIMRASSSNANENLLTARFCSLLMTAAKTKNI